MPGGDDAVAPLAFDAAGADSAAQLLSCVGRRGGAFASLAVTLPGGIAVVRVARFLG